MTGILALSLLAAQYDFSNISVFMWVVFVFTIIHDLVHMFFGHSDK